MFLLAAAFSMTGCGVLEDAVEQGRELASPDAAFGTATRESLASDPEGRTFRVMIESTTEASWPEALTAMSWQLGPHCRDGEAYSPVSHSPELWTGGPTAVDAKHPAGTHFVEVVQCAAKPGYEFEFAVGLPEGDARAAVEARLLEETDVAGGEPSPWRVSTLRFNDRARKYPVLHAAIGQFIADRAGQCEHGVAIRRIVLGTFPRRTAARAANLGHGAMVLGIHAPCQPPALATTAAPAG